MNDNLDKLAEQIRKCERCPLHETRNRAVPGVGREGAGIMIVGEAPGQYEDRQGKPFVGASGKYMDELLETNDIRRDELFVTNVVKCRPPGDRDPTGAEKAACRPWLEAQIEALNPRLIVTLGAAATQHFKPDAKIGQVRGRPIRTDETTAVILPLYHPAAGMHREALRAQIEGEFPRIRAWGDILIGGDETDEGTPQEPTESDDRQATELPPLPSSLAEMSDRTGAPPSDRPESGALYWAIEECAIEMRRLWRGHAANDGKTDPRETRHQLSVLSSICMTLNRQSRQAPDGDYRDWCQHRLRRLIAAGRHLSESVPLICETCGRLFHASTPAFTLEKECGECAGG